MPRHKLSSSRRIANQMNAELEAEIQSPEVQSQVEKRLAELRDLPDDDQVMTAMNTVVATDDREHGSPKARTSKMDLPPAIDAMPDGKEKKLAIKAAAQAAIILGQPAGAVATQYGIPTSQVMDWQNTMITVGAIGRRDRLSDMIWAYIEQEFKSLIAISIVTSDERWVRRQDAGELAHYVSVKADRLLLVLQAFGRVEATRKEYVEQLEILKQHA